MNYYNDVDEKVCAWVQELVNQKLVPQGVVDCKPIQELKPYVLKQFTQCHFFCGIAGWPLALQIAGWDSQRPVWTGSCPCQPFSTAGKNKGKKDDRHLWPDFFRLIRECRPDTIFGEQVEGAIKHLWLDHVSRDMEGEGYAVGSAVLGAHSVGGPHVRQRIYWVANSKFKRLEGDVWSRASVIGRSLKQPCQFSGWDTEPRPCSVDYGVPKTMVRLRGYGNAIVPQVASQFITAYMACL